MSIFILTWCQNVYVLQVHEALFVFKEGIENEIVTCDMYQFVTI